MYLFWSIGIFGTNSKQMGSCFTENNRLKKKKKNCRVFTPSLPVKYCFCTLWDLKKTGPKRRGRPSSAESTPRATPIPQSTPIRTYTPAPLYPKTFYQVRQWPELVEEKENADTASIGLPKWSSLNATHICSASQKKSTAVFSTTTSKLWLVKKASRILMFINLLLLVEINSLNF